MTKLEAQDFTSLTKDDILGDLLYTTAVSYYAELDVMDFVSAKTMGVTAIRLPSETIFSSELKVNKFFGSPISAGTGGLAMDVDRAVTLIKALDGDKDKSIQFMLASGQNSSALEHSVPEQMYSTTENPAHGISAVKALQIANDQGIPIYTINQTNINTIIPQLQLDAGTISDIQNAINAGKEVTVSKTDITYNGWTGCGYIIIDPLTGAGAYMISGGVNGGWLYSTLSWILNFLRDPATNAWVAYITGVLSKLGGIGIALAAIINTFMISFTVTDILVNNDGTLTQKGCAIFTYLATQGVEFLLGALAGSDAAAFIAVLIINAIYIELLSAVITQKICYQ
jgi:hypothetical protein